MPGPAITFICLALATALLSGCSANSEENNTVIYQSVGAVAVAEHEEFGVQHKFTGVVVPSRSADIAFEFAGTVQSVLVDEGDRVEEGELLARLDTSLLDIERRQLQAQLAEAEANLRLVESNLTRHASLETDGFASQQRRDELEANRDAVKAKIQSLLAALDGNLVKQRKSHINSPFTGFVSERYLEDGSSAVPGRAVVRLLESGQDEAHVGVPRQLASTLAVGQSVTVSVDQQLVEGEILAVGGELKTRSHTATVRVRLPETGALPGSLVHLQLQDNIAAHGFSVPQSALTASMRGLWRIYVLVPAEKELYRVEARDLQLRYSGNIHAFVEGGLSDGELIISKGVHKVVPGQLVRIVQDGDTA